jgi:hypothetical protein
MPLHLSVDTIGRLHTNLNDKRDHFSFQIMNFPFLSSYIPTSPAYGVYILQLIHYSRACVVGIKSKSIREEEAHWEICPR